MPVLDERTAADADAAVAAADAIGYPVVLKLCGDTIAHKTERGLVRLGLRDAAAVRDAADAAARARPRPDDGAVELLVAPMVRGNRELIAGLVRDPQFGPCVMLGVGGVLAEALGDVAFRLVPLTDLDADELIDDLATQKLLGPFRGEPAVDRAALRATLLGLSRLADRAPRRRRRRREPAHRRRRQSPSRSTPSSSSRRARRTGVATVGRRPDSATPVRDLGEGFAALFEPRGVIVAGASTPSGEVRVRRAAQHPRGRLRGQGRRDQPRGHAGARHPDRSPSIDDLPEGPWDLVFVCTPAGREPRSPARVRTARRARRVPHERRLRRGGRRRPRAPKRELVALADELGILLAGPNGQGVVSTPGASVRADRRPEPAGGPDRDREPVGQLRVVVRELGDADRASA